MMLMIMYSSENIINHLSSLTGKTCHGSCHYRKLINTLTNKNNRFNRKAVQNPHITLSLILYAYKKETQLSRVKWACFSRF